MAKPDDILGRIARQLGGDAVLAALDRLSGRDLQSLLLHLSARRAERETPSELLRRYQQTPSFALAFVDPRRSLRFHQLAFEAASEFEAIELSPVCPLGTIRTISGIHQNSVLSASRGAEIVADPTPVLAMECARRRHQPAARAGFIRLCTTQRLMRMQPTPAGLLPHFRLFAMVTSAQHHPSLETDELRRHLEVYLRLFQLLGEEGYGFADLTVSVSHTGITEAWLAAAGIDREEIRRSVRTTVWSDPDALLQSRGLTPLRGPISVVSDALAHLPGEVTARLQRLDGDVFAPLSHRFPAARLQLDVGRLEGLGYYTGLCVRITARDAGGTLLPLVDGGYTAWTQELLSDRRERFLITGIGSDLVCARLVRP